MTHEFNIYQGELNKATQIEAILSDQELKFELKNLAFFLNLRFGTNDEEPIKETYYDENKKSVSIEITSNKARNEVEIELSKHITEYNNFPNRFGIKKGLNLNIEN